MRKNSYCSVICPQLDTGSKSKLTSSSLRVTQRVAHFDKLETKIAICMLEGLRNTEKVYEKMKEEMNSVRKRKRVLHGRRAGDLI